MSVPQQVIDQIQTAESALNQQEDTVQQPDNVEPSNQQDDTQYEDFQSKYLTLKGKYDAEVPRLYNEVKQLSTENEFLKGKIEILEKLVSDMKQQTPAQEDTTISKFKEEYPDIYQAVEHLMETKFQNVKQPQQDDSSAKEFKQTVEMVFSTLLSQLAPDWETLNSDPQFLNWLAQPEGLTGRKRHDFLLDAYNRRDAKGVAQFFNAFKAEKSRNPSNTSVSPPAGRAHVPSGGGKPIFTQQEIEEFYRNAALGKLSPDDKARRERDIFEAVRDGRVTLS